MHSKEQYYIHFLLLLFLSSCGQATVRPTAVRLKIGNETSWLKKSLDDRSWVAGNGTTHKGIFTIRFHLDLPNRKKDLSPYAVQVIALGSFDAYWDGNYIGSSGKVGDTREKESPGQHRTVLPLPDSLAHAGTHLLALRISNFHYQRKYAFFNVRSGTYQQLLTAPLKIGTFMFVLAGFFLIGAMYYLFMFFQHHAERLYLVFSLLCILFLCLLVMEYLPTLWGYPYPFQVVRLEMIGILGLGISMLIPYFLNRQFNSFPTISFNLLIGLLLTIVFIAYHGRYDLTSQLMGVVMVSASFVVCLLAVKRKHSGALLVLIALLLGATASWFLYYDYSLYLGFGLLLLAMLYLLSERSRRTEQAYHQALLLSERLKTELLKKSIQPHFLLNTLTALSELIEQSPPAGLRMIVALAGEFELFSRMAEYQLVSILEEIELCRYHLQVMGFRKETDYRLSTTNIDENEYIPPAVLHTAIENGITHSRPSADGSISFHLSFSQTQFKKTYTLTTQAINREKGKNMENGTGTAYIEARLRESYGEAWELSSKAVPQGWLTTIIILK
ncbi:histidine kinase [Pedobacter sp. UC225_61]|uniref:histidine kinase n=1 Tax=Pedobacter sp. UC225_61 TaxID=3374623 RepID=UPI0037A24B57